MQQLSLQLTDMGSTGGMSRSFISFSKFQALHYRFCYITHFFEHQSQRGRTKMFHGQWFVHGSETILQETAHSRALFLLNSCDSNPINAIYQKCNFRFLELGEQEPFDDFAVDANDFHCRQVLFPLNSYIIVNFTLAICMMKNMQNSPRSHLTSLIIHVNLNHASPATRSKNRRISKSFTSWIMGLPSMGSTITSMISFIFDLMAMSKC